MLVIENLILGNCQIVGREESGEYKYNCLLSNGNILAGKWFDIYIINPDGSLIIGLKKDNYTLYGLINPLTNLYLQPQFLDLNYAQEKACIATKFNRYQKPLYGYIDTQNGNFITPIGFSYAGVFHDKIARVKYKNKTSFIARDRIMTNLNNPQEYILAPRKGVFSDCQDGIIHAHEDFQEVWYNNEGKLLLRRNFPLTKR